LSVFQQAHIVARNRLNKRLGCVELPEGNSEVVCIVKRVQQITVERMDVLEARECLNRGGEALGEGLGGVLDFSRVKCSNSADLETCADL